jgi:exodeoxyribonuclease VII small subunit
MKDMSFEKALAELESIVGKLESGELPLDESLALFEQGVQLAKYLHGELGKAEKKIEILLKNKDGELKPEPFNLAEEAPGKDDPGEGESGENESLPF